MSRYEDKEWLKKKYLDEEMSMAEIGEITDSSDTVIHYWVHKYGIEARDSGRSCHHINLTSFGQQFLDGLMLGDGEIEGYPKSARYKHGDSYQEYINWLSPKLLEIGLKNEFKRRNDGAYHLWTKSYRGLKPQYNQWYPTGHKKTRIPSRVEITPVVLFNWFIGDGTYRQDKKGSWELFITSTTFEEGLSRIIQQIRNLGISCTKAKQEILILKDSHKDFFDYILSSGIEIPPGYEYKFSERNQT